MAAMPFCQLYTFMKNILVTQTFVFCAFGLLSQNTFSISYPASPDPADRGANIVIMDDGYLIGCGTVNQQNGREYSALLKIGWNAEFVWSKSYYWEPYQPDKAYDDPVVLSGDKMYMFCHTESESTQKNFQLFSLNLDGDTLWSHIYVKDFDDIASGMIKLSDSTLILYGMEGTSDVLNVARALKVNNDGSVLWDKTYGEEFGRSTLRDLRELPDGSLIMASVICPYGASCVFNRYAALTKADKDGNKLWTKTYNKSGSQVKALALPLDNGGYALAWTRDTFHWSVDPYPPVIYFLDSLGNVESEYDGFVRPGNYYMSKLKRMSNGDMLGVGGTLDFSDGDTYGGWLFRLTQQGELIWERRISDRRYPDLFGQFFDAIETPDGDIIAVGNIDINSFQNTEVWIVKLDSDGCFEPGCTADSIFITPVFEASLNEKDLYEIYPNPANNFISVQVNETLNFHDAALEIMDISGRRLELIGLESHSQTLNTLNLGNGIYFVRLLYKGHLLPAKKMVILR